MSAPSMLNMKFNFNFDCSAVRQEPDATYIT